MATRIRFSSTDVALITPTLHSGWNNTSGIVRYNCIRSIIQSAFQEETLQIGFTGVGFRAVIQFVLAGLGNQTLGGTFKGQIKCAENIGPANLTLAVAMSKCDSAGSNVIEILSPQASDNTSTQPPEMEAVINTNRSFLTSGEVATISIPDTALNVNDAILIEIGYRADSSSSTNTGSIEYGCPSLTTDLPEDQTDVGTKNAWIEFSQDLIFGQQFPFRTTVGARRVR